MDNLRHTDILLKSIIFYMFTVQLCSLFVKCLVMFSLYFSCMEFPRFCICGFQSFINFEKFLSLRSSNTFHTSSFFTSGTPSVSILGIQNCPMAHECSVAIGLLDFLYSLFFLFVFQFG